MLHNKLWLYKEIPQEDIDRVSSNAGISRFLAKIFISRGMEDKESIKKFLNPSLDMLYDPFLLKDMQKAVDRIILAIERKEKIVIYGDYDVDGITSTSVLYNFLKSRNADVDYYIPDRIDEGYGLTAGTVEKVCAMNASLVITVDCGITAIDEVNYINNRKIDVIVTDHHECKEILPDAHAVISPCRPDSQYPFSYLAGVGVVFKLVHAICIAMGLGTEYLNYLDLVALGTVADVVPLVDENRVIVSCGLDKVRNTANTGLKKLVENCNPNSKPITSWMIGYVMAPRINAAGRMGDARRAVRLFTTEDETEASDIVLQLNDENRLRQDMEAEILNEAISIIDADESYMKEKVLVVAGEGWHHGVIGIVASRITEKYHRPCLLFSKEGDIAKGSGRSIDSFDLFEALTHCQDLIDRFGGHEQAAGLTVPADNLPAFRKKINEYADSILNDEDLMPQIEIDVRIDKDDLNRDNIIELDALAPFGAGNPAPVFVYRDLKIGNIRTVGDNRHLKLKLQDEEHLFDAIGFNMGDKADVLRTGDMVDAACTLEINTWNSIDTIQMNLRDLRFGSETAIKEQYYLNLDRCMEMKESAEAGIFNESCDSILQRVKPIGRKEFIDLAGSQQNMVIIANTLETVLYIESLLKKMSVDIKKVLEICYTIFYNIDVSKIYALINPEPDTLDFSKIDNVVFCGRWVKDSYMKSIIGRIDKSGIYFLDDELIDNIYSDELIPDRRDMVAVYQYVKANCRNNKLVDSLLMLSRRISNSYKINMNSFKLKRSLEIFDELKLMEYREIGGERISLLVADNGKKKTNLENSKSYRYLQQLKAKLKEA